MKLPKLAQWFLGAIFLVFGVNGYLNFIPTPPMEGSAMVFMGGLFSAPYFIHLLKLTEIACGLLLLIGVYVPLALVILAPIVVNILLFHIFLAPAGVIMAIVITVAYLYLVVSHLDAYKKLLEK